MACGLNLLLTDNIHYSSDLVKNLFWGNVKLPLHKINIEHMISQ